MIIRRSGLGLTLPPGTILQDVTTQSSQVAFDVGHGVFFNAQTGEVFPGGPPAGTSSLTQIQRADGSIYAGYGPGWVAQTADEAAQLKAITEAQIAAQKAGTTPPQLPAFWFERTGNALVPLAAQPAAPVAVQPAPSALSDWQQKLTGTWSVAGYDIPVWLLVGGVAGLLWWFSKKQ